MKVGDIRTRVEIAQWQECEGCGKPAKYCLTFLLEHFRRNPASKAYGKDDCSRCSDLEVFSCENCKHTLSRAPTGYDEGYRIMPLKSFKHRGFYWKQTEEKMKQPTVKLRRLTNEELATAMNLGVDKAVEWSNDNPNVPDTTYSAMRETYIVESVANSQLFLAKQDLESQGIKLEVIE